MEECISIQFFKILSNSGHYYAVHFIPLLCSTSLNDALHHTTMQYITPQCSAVHPCSADSALCITSCPSCREQGVTVTGRNCPLLQCSTAQYTVVQHSTVQYSAVQSITLQCSTVQQSTVQYYSVQYKTRVRSTIQFTTHHHMALQHSGED